MLDVPLLEARHLSLEFTVHDRVGATRTIKVLDDICLSIQRGDIGQDAQTQRLFTGRKEELGHMEIEQRHMKIVLPQLQVDGITFRGDRGLQLPEITGAGLRFQDGKGALCWRRRWRIGILVY